MAGLSLSLDKETMLKEFRAWIDEKGYAPASYIPPEPASNWNKTDSYNGYPTGKIVQGIFHSLRLSLKL